MTRDGSADVSSVSTDFSERLAEATRPLPRWESLVSFASAALVVAEVEARKLRHDPWEVVTRALQPLLWLTVFGQAVARARLLSEQEDYLTFMAPGILAQSVMFTSIFYGLAIIWERDAGILQKILVLPVPRASFVAGKALGAGLRALLQAAVVVTVALLLQVRFHLDLFSLVTCALAVLLGAGVFASLSMLLATLLKTRERFMGIGQVLTIPLFFASNAIYPIHLMPAWLQVLAQVNPLTYLVELLRDTLVDGQRFGVIQDWLVLLAWLVLLQAIVSRRYDRVLL
ncbi:ABC transporter permease [Thermomicrobium roseum]|uniref:Transport permease protein n=1 Tax=Thermomicrobium roseum (strain ATCC 27502 / DSM 5159 / P-2) TaxID=309801 RepID=B9L0K3_THERP|nr:ABC transporter permease [Thermomicrobium roseum]ACM05640.1 ABC-2 type transporter superfamily [Thermomicrobium roseum DSM 5159]